MGDKLIVGGVGVLGLVLAAIGAVAMMRQSRFRRQARTALGTVTGLRSSRSRARAAGEVLAPGAYYPTVRFLTADGQDVEAEARFASNSSPGQAGQQVTVHYDPADPRRFTTNATSQTAGCLAVGFVLAGGLVFAAAALLLLATG
jgi:hypothetical protein